MIEITESSGDARPANAEDLPAITKRILCIGGFTQDRLSSTGLAGVWMHLRQRHTSIRCCVSSHTWKDDWDLVVDHLLSTGPRDVRQFDIRIIAYSWGVGHGAVTLAKKLRAHGVAVKRLVSCDGVYRLWYAPWRAIWSPLWGLPEIAIPSNVQRVDYLRQDNTLPRGAKIGAESPDQTEVIDHGMVRGHSHLDIDNSRVFLELALAAGEEE